jgi:hypothetical protein
MRTYNAPHQYQNSPSWQAESAKRHEENQMIAERYGITEDDVEEKLTKSERLDLLRACRALKISEERALKATQKESQK